MARPNNDIATTLEDASLNVKAELIEGLDCGFLDDPILTCHVVAWVQPNVASPSWPFDLQATFIPSQDVVGFHKERLAGLAVLTFLHKDIACDIICQTQIIEPGLDGNPLPIVLKLTLSSVESERASTLTLKVCPSNKATILAMDATACTIFSTTLAKEAPQALTSASLGSTCQNAAIVADHIATGVEI